MLHSGWKAGSAAAHMYGVGFALSPLEKENHGQTVIYRFLAAGHPNCERARGPYFDRLYPHDEYWYNWSDLSDHIAMWKASLESLGDEQYSYLGIEETRVRPNGHLHPSKALPTLLPSGCHVLLEFHVVVTYRIRPDQNVRLGCYKPCTARFIIV